MFKVIKYKKLIICVIFILGIAFYFTAKHISGNHADVNEIHTIGNGIYLQHEQVIDKRMVIEALNNKAELVTNSGVVNKTYIYSDSIFKGSGYIKDLFGERTLETIVKGYFKTGYDLSSIGSSDIVVYGKTLFLKLSKEQMQLISLDIPFDEIQYHAKNGLFRSGLGVEEKQALYTKIRSAMEHEILSNERIKENTYESAVKAITDLLEKLPNCDKVVVQQKLV